MIKKQGLDLANVPFVACNRFDVRSIMFDLNGSTFEFERPKSMMERIKIVNWVRLNNTNDHCSLMNEAISEVGSSPNICKYYKFDS